MTGAISVLAVLAAPRVEVQLRIPLPADAAEPWVSAFDERFVRHDPRSGAVMWVSRQMVFRFDPRQRKVVPMGGGHFGELQVDCGLGLATVLRRNPDTNALTGETYDLATGKHLSTVDGWPKRVGRLVITRDTTNNLTTYTDAVTGETLWQEDLWQRDKINKRAPFGDPIWATPKRWLFIIGEEGRHPNDKKGVVDVAVGRLQEVKRVHLSDYAMTFDGIVGNPEIGPFAVFEASNRGRYCTGVFRSDLTRVPGKFSYVTDISKHGILDRDAKVEGSIDDGGTTIICSDPQTGKVRWRATTKSPGKWVGGNVLAFDRLLDGKTGKSLGKLKLPQLLGLSPDGSFVGIEGKSLVVGQIRAR